MSARIPFVIAGLIALILVLLVSAYISEKSLVERTIKEEKKLPLAKSGEEEREQAVGEKKRESPLKPIPQEVGEEKQKTQPQLPLNETTMPGVNRTKPLKPEAWIPPRIDVRYRWVGEGLELYIKVDLPDPCHRVRVENTSVKQGTIQVYLEATQPPPRTYCIQVVPKPYTAMLKFKLEKNRYLVKIIVNGKTVKELVVLPP